MTTELRLRPRSLAPVFPELQYDRGFVVGDKHLPYFSFCRPGDSAHWSDHMMDFIAEASKTHFIDRYNRALAIEGLRPALEATGSVYLDIGCASGFMLEDAVAAFPRSMIMGSDYFSRGLEDCHRTLPDIPLLQMDITDCPLPDHSLDGISCLNVLEHITDDEKALREMNRLLKPGGRLFVTVPAAPHLFDLYDDVHQHVRRYTDHELREKLTRNGFRILRMNYFGVVIYPLFYGRKKLNRMLYKNLSPSGKMAKAKSLAISTGRLPVMEKLCAWESRLGERFQYPFGIRLYAVLTSAQ